MLKLALIGKDIEYSLSKVIHEYIFKKNHMDVQYDIFSIDENDFDKIIKYLIDNGYTGFNVTTPYKEKIISYLYYIDETGKRANSCNTVLIENGKLSGYNTDYYGFSRLLSLYDIELSDNTYIIGTGGAAKTVAEVIIDQGYQATLVSRNKKEYLNLNDLENRNIDILINATPLGQGKYIDEIPVKKDIIKKAKIVIDLNYNPRITNFLKIAGSKYNGLIMLIYQAYLADMIYLKADYLDFNLNEILEVVGEE